MTYATTFFPDANTPDRAKVVTLATGEVRTGVDLRMRPVVAVTVSGRLESPKGFEFGGDVKLRHAADTRYDGHEAQAWVAPDGTFTLLDVPAGSYVFEPTRFARGTGGDVTVHQPDSQLTHLPLTVTPSGVRNLVVPMVQGTSIKGSTVLQGSSKPPDEVSFVLQSIDRPLEYSFGFVERGQFEFDGVIPGRYELSFQQELQLLELAWRLGRVTDRGLDVTGRPLTVGLNGLNGVVVTLTDHAASLSGTVNGASGTPVTDATVVLFPVDRSSWQDAKVWSTRFQTSRALRGQYGFPNVPPGEYFITAVDETTMDAWPSTAFLTRTASMSSRVTVKAGVSQAMPLAFKQR